MYSISSMAKEAAGIFNSLATDPGCDRAMADRMAFECENYISIAEDWLALLKMSDLIAKGEYAAVSSIARRQHNTRLALMAHLERAKEKWVIEALAMRTHSIFMQMFDDIATCAESEKANQLDLMDASTFASKRFFDLR